MAPDVGKTARASVRTNVMAHMIPARPYGHWSGLGLVVALVLTSSASPARGQLGPEGQQAAERAAELAVRWSLSAHQVIEAANAYTSDQSGEMLAGLIARGATRAVRENAAAERLQTADTDIRRFAQRMVEAGSKDASGRLRLGESSFSAARSSICPIYPFC